MGYRKLIGFGDSSFVISLPKEWVEKNGLKKGDLINLEEDAELIKITPQNIKPVVMNAEITIDYDGDIRNLKTRLLHAYIGNYNIINIKKQGIEKYTSEIRNIVSNFIGLDVVEQKDDRLIVTDVLDISGISIYNYLRRVDRLLISMGEDVKQILEWKADRRESLDQKDEDVNRLSNLILKVLRRAQNRRDMKILNLRIDEVFYYWDLIINLEEIGDQLKRMIRHLKKKSDPRIISLFEAGMESYNLAMKANYTKNKELAVSIMANRKKFFTECETLAEMLDHGGYLVVDKIKQIDNLSGNIAKTFLKLGNTEKPI